MITPTGNRVVDRKHRQPIKRLGESKGLSDLSPIHHWFVDSTAFIVAGEACRHNADISFMCCNGGNHGWMSPLNLVSISHSLCPTQALISGTESERAASARCSKQWVLHNAQRQHKIMRSRIKSCPMLDVGCMFRMHTGFR